MQIETDNLLTITNFASLKGLTRQHMHRLVDAGVFNTIAIDGIVFIINDEKASIYERIRKEKTKVNKED